MNFAVGRSYCAGMDGMMKWGLHMISLDCKFVFVVVVVVNLPLWLYLYLFFSFEIIAVNTALYECILLS